MDQNLRDTLLEVIENSLDAQLRAVRRLRSSGSGTKNDAGYVKKLEKTGMSQIEMAHDILASTSPLHIKDILAAIHKRFGVEVDRESLVSALSKRVARGDRFQRVARNTFSLLNPPTP